MRDRTLIAVSWMVLVAAGIAGFSQELRAAEKPNIVLFFVDDMGYRHIEPFGSQYPTSDLNRMAAEGMKMTDFYVSATQCTPSRASLMTGSYAERIGMHRSVVFPGDDRGLNPNEITIAEILKEAGYVTGCFGKWHLGDQPEFLPTEQGFDVFEGIPYSNDMWPQHPRSNRWPNGACPLPYMRGKTPVAHIPDGDNQAVLTEAICNAAVDFVNRHADERFFAYVPFTAVHNPKYAEEKYLEKARELGLPKPDLAALIMQIDACVGRMMDTLRRTSANRTMSPTGIRNWSRNSTRSWRNIIGIYSIRKTGARPPMWTIRNTSCRTRRVCPR